MNEKIETPIENTILMPNTVAKTTSTFGNNQPKVDEEKEYNLQIYIFCPMINDGIMFYDKTQKTDGKEMSMPFTCDGFATVQWDDKVNGPSNEIKRSFWRRKLESGTSLMVTSYTHDEIKDNEPVKYDTRTLIVSEKVFVNVLTQLKKGEELKSVDLGTKIEKYMFDPFIDNAYPDESLNFENVTDGFENTIKK